MAFSKICEYINCTGCGACTNICPKQCIVMEPNDEGFYYPQVNADVCVECGLCRRICPENIKLKRNKPLETLAAFSKDNGIREISSSGGLFTIIATDILNHGGVVYGASFDDSLRLSHIKAETIEELSLLRGSKYLQSNIVAVYKEIQQYVDEQRIVLFVGTPCQVAGIKSYLKKNLDLLFTIDVVCHGVPSPKAFESYIRKLNLINKGASKVGFTFRDLQNWGYAPSIIIDGKLEKLTNEKRVYLDYFLRGDLSRESCYRCQYANEERISDITLADFWGIGKKEPYQYDTRKGVNLVLINSEKGKNLFCKIESEVCFEQRSFSEAALYNSQLIAPPIRPKNRDCVYKLFISSSLIKLHLMQMSLLNQAKFLLKKIFHI